MFSVFLIGVFGVHSIIGVIDVFSVHSIIGVHCVFSDMSVLGVFRVIGVFGVLSSPVVVLFFYHCGEICGPIEVAINRGIFAFHFNTK